MSSAKHAPDQLPHVQKATRSSKNEPLIWVLSSTTGILTTRLLLASASFPLADTLLFAHILLALSAYIYNYGPMIFFRLPRTPISEWRVPIGLPPRSIKTIWINRLCSFFCPVVTFTSLMCGYCAMAELKNLPVTILLMQVDSIPRALWEAVFGLLWLNSMCRRDWREMRLATACSILQVCSAIGFFWFCWSYSRQHFVGVVLAVVSAVSASAATMVHHWLTSDIRQTTVDEHSIEALDAVILAINAFGVIVRWKVQFGSLVALVAEFGAVYIPLILLNLFACSTAMYTSGGMIRRLRTCDRSVPMDWTQMVIPIVWFAVLLAVELSISGLQGASMMEMVVCGLLMVGRHPIENGYEALAVVCDWMGDWLPFT